MPSLKDLRIRINSVRSTQKITSAMKMVAASKLRRAQEQAEAGRPYADRMDRMVGSLAQSLENFEAAPKLLVGTGKEETHLLVVATSDRGLCGAFNSSIVRAARRRIRALQNDGKNVKILCVGRKGQLQLKRDYGRLIVDRIDEISKRRLSFNDAEDITSRILALFEQDEFDVCTVIYNHFESPISQVITERQLIPLSVPEAEEQKTEPGLSAIYEYEPEEEELLGQLLPRNFTVQIYRALLENAASEQGARMTAMDNATRNAGELIDKLTLNYNRTRQAYITKELIEIVSGAEAL
ncbi:MAG: F0F1 ATP synthase subunit gamma [Alphaproteobacteria bacterium]|nr:F0F1 ATP synthase subunit gamma [Alphaproteobacteria bacterium]